MRLTRNLNHAFIVAASCLATHAAVSASDIRSDEKVIFFPTSAHLDEADGEWVIPIHGWIFEPETNSLRRRAGLAALKSQLDLEADAAATRILEERLGAFIVDNESGKRIEITIGEEMYRLAESDSNGHFRDTLRLPVASAESLAEEGWLTFVAVTRQRDENSFSGRAQLVSPQGVSVISDIDDTLKISNVTDKRQLIARTFFREFEPVDGMVSFCDAWSAGDAAFHYVSSSPWQLYAPLATFFDEFEFPEGSWHLKYMSLDDLSLLSLFADPLEDKLKKIEEILSRYPERDFVFVGDSGEQDPEVYGELARRHPQRVSRIYIRLASEEQDNADRFQQAFRDVPGDRWTVFRDPEDLQLD